MFVKNDSKNIAGVEDDKATAVTISALSDNHREDFEHIDIEARGCFRNCYEIVSRFPDKYRYVLGLNTSFGFAFEHAFIKDLSTGEYIDPTLDSIGRTESFEGNLSLIEFTSDEIAEIIVLQKMEAYPPDFKVMEKLSYKEEIFLDYKEYSKEQSSLAI
jgi:hypothetical protein